MTNMTNDSVIFREREFLKIPKYKFIFIYNINIIYKYEMQTILPSFVTIVTFCHELTARMFGYPEKYEYLCNSKIKQ